MEDSAQLHLSKAQKTALGAGTAYLVKGFQIREGDYAGRNSGEIIWKAYHSRKGPFRTEKDSEPGIWMLRGIINDEVFGEVSVMDIEATGMSEYLAEISVRDEWEKINCVPYVSCYKIGILEVELPPIAEKNLSTSKNRLIF